MIGTDEQALTCDMAESYGIFDFWALPVKTAATLAAGLRPFSRIWGKMHGLSVPLDAFLLASIHDNVRMLWWAQTEDANKNQNRPQSITEILMGPQEDESESEVVSFDGGEDFMNKWNELTGGDRNG